MFLDNTPKRFTPRADIQKEVEEKMKTDTAFKKQVQKVKGKRSKTTPKPKKEPGEERTVTFAEEDEEDTN